MRGIEDGMREQRDQDDQHRVAVSRPLRNLIRPSKPRAIAPADSQTHRATTPKESSAPARPPKTDTQAVPAAVAQRFVKLGHSYFFADGARAFTDRGNRLTTPSENTEVIRSLIDIAQARGWEQITVRGTERFRKEAWMAAKVAGLVVKGYRPTEVEQAQAVRRAVSGSLPAMQGDAHRQTRFSADDTRVRSGDSVARRTAPPERVRNAYAERQEAVLRGVLVDHGAAPYRHQHNGERSYFVLLETAKGSRTVWGVDLERALRDSLTQPKPGDTVGVRAVRREPVTLRRKLTDAEGKVVGEQAQTVHRNRWIVEQQSFFEERARAASMVRDASKDARQGVRQHPELAGTYVYLQGAKELASKRIRDPEDRKRFIATVRTALADSVARGEPLPPVRVKTKGSRTTRPERQSPAQSQVRE